MQRNRWEHRIHVMGVILAASLCVTEGLILAQYGIREALPLHLCSMSALAALASAFGARGLPVDFLWYLGMPGALAALLFPAPAVSVLQPLLNASYAVTHTLILLIPAAMLFAGVYPRPGRGVRMYALLGMLAVPVFGVNLFLGTDYLFLMRPPVGTPLETLYAHGYGTYLLVLSAAAGACCAGMGRIVRVVCRRRRTGGRRQ